MSGILDAQGDPANPEPPLPIEGFQWSLDALRAASVRAHQEGPFNAFEFLAGAMAVDGERYAEAIVASYYEVIRRKLLAERTMFHIPAGLTDPEQVVVSGDRVTLPAFVVWEDLWAALRPPPAPDASTDTQGAGR